MSKQSLSTKPPKPSMSSKHGAATPGATVDRSSDQTPLDQEGGQLPTAGRLFGTEQPRIFTQPLRPLTPDTSAGFDCIDFAERVLKVQLYPWQKWLLIHALELLPDGNYRFETVLVLVSRQNGKTLVMMLLALWRMFVDEASLVIGTAQKLDVAKEAWDAALAMALDTPVLRTQIARVDRSHGEEAFSLKTSERYKVSAANRRGGRGLSGDLVLLDELREHQDWGAWGAVTNTTMARLRSMIWCFSNAGDATSVVLRTLRKMALWAQDVHGGDEDRLAQEWQLDVAADDEDDGAGSGDLDTDSLAIFEWSAIPGKSKWNRANWCQANPSLGWNEGFTERKLRSHLKMPDHVSRPENLCEWSGSGGVGPFGDGNWERCAEVGVTIAGASKLRMCIDVSENREMTSVAIAGQAKDGRWVGLVVERRAGTHWLKSWLKSRVKPGGKMADRLVALTLQTNGAPVSALVDTVDGLAKVCARYGVEFVSWAGADLARAAGSAFDLVQGRKTFDDTGKVTAVSTLVYHADQPILNQAAAMARTKRAGDSWVWDRTGSDVDIAPLVAWCGALWLCTHHQVKEPLVSAYEDDEPFFV